MANGILARFLPDWAGAVLTGVLELSGGAAALGVQGWAVPPAAKQSSAVRQSRRRA